MGQLCIKAGHGNAYGTGHDIYIEPMVNMGSDEIFTDEEDGWTVYTADGKPSAQWEIQVLVTEDGYEIMSY